MLIPTDTAWYCLSHKLTKPFALYILLKDQCSGKIRLNDDLVNLTKAVLNYQSEKSIYNNLNKLLKLNFIGYNPISKYYFIRGWSTIQSIIKTGHSTAAIFEEDNNNLQPFLFATLIQKEIRRKRYRTAQSKARANQSDSDLSPYSFSIRYMANILKISVCSCHKLKNDAMEAGFIQVCEDWKPTIFDYEDLKLYHKIEPEKQPKIRNGMIHIRNADLIKTNVIIVKRKHGKKKNKY